MFQNYYKNVFNFQRRDLDQIGYSMLTKDQFKFLYGPKSPFNDSITLKRLLPIIESSKINQAINYIFLVNNLNFQLIEEDIKKISKMSSFNIRQQDVVVGKLTS